MFSKENKFWQFLVSALAFLAIAFCIFAASSQGKESMALFGQVVLWAVVLATLVGVWPTLDKLHDYRKAEGDFLKGKALTALLSVAGGFGSVKPGLLRRVIAFVRDVLVVFLLLSANIVWLAFAYTMLVLLMRGASDEVRKARGVS